MCVWGEGRFSFSAHHDVCCLADILIRLLFAAFVLREFLIEGCLGLIPTRASEFYSRLSSFLDKKFLSQGVHT